MYLLRKQFDAVVAVFAVIFILVTCSGRTESETLVNKDDVYLTLVNKTHELPANWEKLVQIDTVKNSLDETIQIEHKTYASFLELREALLSEGIQIELDSVYRSVEDQQELWDYFTEEYGEKYTETYVAVPGYSEHHTGLAVDIFVIKDGKVIRENDEMIADRKDFAVIHDHLAEYGFILRYLEGKEEITGYGYEPWHLRFVNSKEIAEEITSRGLTLEEYLSEP